MMASTFSVDGLILGGAFLLMCYHGGRWLMRKWDQQEKVAFSKAQIHSNALWDYYHGINPPKEYEHKPGFEEQLDDETQKKFFKTKRGKEQ